MTRTESDCRRTVGLFVTCLADLFRPSVAFAAVRLLEAAGCRVEVPGTQTCCGQPAFNSGDRNGAALLARHTAEAFRGYEWIVVPSGSCAAMLKRHYGDLIGEDGNFGDRVWELTSFLADVCGFGGMGTRLDARVTYHDGCSGLRELGVRDQPRTLLGQVEGVELLELEGAETCCGFGGTFCVKYPGISAAMVGDKTADIAARGADLLLAGELGCLMNIAGRLRREGSPVAVRHVAEALAGMTGEVPAL